MKTVEIDGAAVKDEVSFHQTFRDALGFPDFYGHNFDAWIDCMGYLDDPAAGMSSINVGPGEVLVLVVESASQFKKQSPALWHAFLECAAFVNWRCTSRGAPPILVVSAYA